MPHPPRPALLPAAALAAAVAALAPTPHAHAAAFNVTGSWSTTITGQGYTNEPFAGTASFTYNDALISSFGFDNVQGPLTSFTFTPNPVGNTTFDLSNTGFYVNYKDGQLHQIILGGTTGGVNSILFATDDFSVSQHFGGGLSSVGVSVATEPLFESRIAPNNATIDFTVTPVPEPASLALLTLACTTLRRRRAA